MKKLKAATIKIKKIGFYFLIFLTILVLSFLGYTLAYANKIYPGVLVAGLKLSGFSKTEAKNILKSKIESSQKDKVTLSYQDEKWEINLKELNFQYDIDKTIEKAWRVGRRDSFFSSLKEQVLALVAQQALDMALTVDKKKWEEKIKKIAAKVDMPLSVISFILKDGQIEMVQGKEGQKLLEQETQLAFIKALGNFQNNAPLIVVKTTPKIKEDQVSKIQEARTKFQKMISGDLVLKWQEEKFVVSPKEIASWAQFTEKEILPFEYILDVEVNEQKAKDYLQSIAKKINQEPVDAKLSIADGRAVVFQAHQEGYKLNQEEAFKKIKEVIFENPKEINLKVEVLKPAVRTETINELGIKELIGEGSSSFKGSPQNRIHNITVGANLFNGVLIKPGDVFSFNQILGEVSPSKGYLPELVIKEDRLIPETGGGLCQVSTTMFRAAVYSGVEILERTPHSFRVRYYEPPVGLDATVYNPKPDLKFKNDTPGYILIQTKIEGSKLTFQFYGTKDGRTVEIKGPFTSDYRSPGGSVYIDDPSLPAGETKQIERAVPGLTATIYWTVYKGGQVLHQKTFVSKYVPWPAKYKKGTGPAPVPPPEQQPPPEQPPPAEQLPQQ